MEVVAAEAAIFSRKIELPPGEESARRPVNEYHPNR